MWVVRYYWSLSVGDHCNVTTKITAPEKRARETLCGSQVEGEGFPTVKWCGMGEGGGGRQPLVMLLPL